MSPSVLISIAAAKGSTPRDAGTSMTVTATGQSGTIGGGALEWEAVRIARHMLQSGKPAERRTVVLGPDMGQCCGGAVTLDFTVGARATPSSAGPIWIWGAGHVGRAIAAVLAPLDAGAVTLVDTSGDRLPDPLPDGVTPLVASDMTRVVRHAPRDARHFILTYSHDIDLTLCDALLRHGFTGCGLIGSDTKWARFRKRLAALGHAEEDIRRIACPIGDPSLGKHPQAIAIGVAARLLRDTAATTNKEKSDRDFNIA